MRNVFWLASLAVVVEDLHDGHNIDAVVRTAEAMGLQHLSEPRRLFRKHQCGWLVLNTDDDPVDVLGRELRVLVGRPV